uniref:Tyrosyl-DNA phosphodiesterase n=1 Tax=Rhizophora mucronata TaxID=61149 RepID=A0A2P2JFV9_RHIMU
MFSDEMQLDRAKFLEETNPMGHNSQGSVSSGQRSKRVFAVCANDAMHSGFNLSRPKCRGIVSQAKFFLSQCRVILKSGNPISRIREHASPDCSMETTYAGNNRLNNSLSAPILDTSKFCAGGETEANKCVMTFRKKEPVCTNLQFDMDTVNNVQKGNGGCVCIGGDHSRNKGIARAYSENDDANQTCNAFLPTPTGKNPPSFNGVCQLKASEEFYPAPGKNFYLNRLHSLGGGPFSDHNVISLPELLYPIESISQIFIATFTCDVSWFLSYCQIPSQLPVTIACHNTEHCWSSSADKRISTPYSDFPYVVVVFPQFPEEIAFGKDRKRQGIACHHPKLFVLQREDSIRVIITSANLVANQWNNVTNTIWWQDFPARSAPELSSLFVRVSDRELDQDSGSDFVAQLAVFMASLLTDVPSQAHWIIELTKYNFSEAMGYLIASVPGIYSHKSLHEYQCSLQPSGEKVISTVETSVVGLSHLFRTAADTNGAQLKRLAAFMGKSHENDYGMVEIVLRRNINVPADLNAVSVLVPNPDLFSQGGEFILPGLVP